MKKRVFNSQCGASRSPRDQKSCPPWQGQRPLAVCWSQWPAGPPACWVGHWAATCMWSVRRLARICTLFPLEKGRKRRQHKRKMLAVRGIQYEDLAVNTGTLLPQQIQYLCCVRGAQAACSVSLCWIIPLQSAEQHITLEQLSAPIWGLKHTSVISPAQENSFKIKKAGSGSASPIMLCNYSDLLPRPGSLVGRNRMWMLANFRSCPQCPGKLPNWHLFVSRASLAVSKVDAAGCIIDWAVQLCPSSDLQTIHFLFYCTTSPLVAVWRVWPWPGRWKTGSNYLAAAWERAAWHHAGDPVKRKPSRLQTKKLFFAPV